MTDAIREVIIEGRQHGWAAEAEKKEPIVTGEQRFEHEAVPHNGARPFLYADSFFGWTRFAGMELVYDGGRPVWSMVYSGGMLPGFEAEAEGAYRFLRRVLIAMAGETRFAGGVAALWEDDWMYGFVDGLETIHKVTVVREHGNTRRQRDGHVYTCRFLFGDIDGKAR